VGPAGFSKKNDTALCGSGSATTGAKFHKKLESDTFNIFSKLQGMRQLKIFKCEPPLKCRKGPELAQEIVFVFAYFLYATLAPFNGCSLFFTVCTMCCLIVIVVSILNA
jgi:hypothetical protein